MIFVWATAGVLVLSLCSCTTVQTYPRCYLFQAPTDADVQRADRDDRSLVAVVARGAEVATSRDSIAVETTAARHKRLEHTWSASGCVNLRKPPPYNAGPDDKHAIGQCHELLRDLVEQNRAKHPVPPTDIIEKYPGFSCH